MPVPTSQSLEQLVDIETPEQVVFSYTIAGIGSRAAAALIDYLLCLTLIFAIWVAAAAFFGVTHHIGSAPWVLAILIFFVFGVFWGYYTLFEGLWDGQTPGKRYVGLRVVRDGGYSITFAASAVRNIVRVIDLQPGASYGVGMLTALLSPSGKRLGDYAAGTLVVRERAVTIPAAQTAGAGALSASDARQWARWREFSTLLVTAQRRGLRGLSESEVSDFVARYREVATDLARIKTAARGREIDSIFYVSRLVAGGHNLLYRERRLTSASAWEYLTYTVPREIRRSTGAIAIAALLLFGPAVIAYVAVARTPAVATEFIPQSMIDRAEDGVRRAKNEEGYVPDPELFRPVMSSEIIANNVQVTYIAFAGGMLAGLGTVAALVFNGISLGGVLGLYQSKGILPLILAFVAPHGVLELSAIAIAGGAGLLLGAALLIPGARTRRAALVEQGRRAIRLVAASTLLLVVAGTLEGFVSPIPWWTLREKLTVSAITAVLLALYVNLDRGRHPFTRA